MQIARETDLPDLLEHLGYQVRQIGRYHTTKEMDSLRIRKNARCSCFPPQTQITAMYLLIFGREVSRRR